MRTFCIILIAGQCISDTKVIVVKVLTGNDSLNDARTVC